MFDLFDRSNSPQSAVPIVSTFFCGLPTLRTSSQLQFQTLLLNMAYILRKKKPTIYYIVGIVLLLNFV